MVQTSMAIREARLFSKRGQNPHRHAGARRSRLLWPRSQGTLDCELRPCHRSWNSTVCRSMWMSRWQLMRRFSSTPARTTTRFACATRILRSWQSRSCARSHPRAERDAW